MLCVVCLLLKWDLHYYYFVDFEQSLVVFFCVCFQHRNIDWR
eukprot:UN19020